MPELSRRDYLVLVAGGVGAAAGIGEVTERREAVAVPAVGGLEESVSDGGGGGGGGVSAERLAWNENGYNTGGYPVA